MRTLTICGHDIAEFTLVIPAIPHPADTTAAEFLRDTITKSCGVTLPITDTPAAHSIILGSREPSPEVKYDGFRITTDEGNLYLDGNVARGTLYAAYDFAEKYLDYRYFAADCEVIPTEGEANVPAGLNLVDNPVIESRAHSWIDNCTNPEFASHTRVTAYDNTADQKYGGRIPGMNYACHTFKKFCPPEIYFKEHPEYYTLWEGKRLPVGDIFDFDGQLCLTNPDVFRIVKENVLKELREHPETHVIDVSQNDNNHYCQCERCAAVDEEEGSHSGTVIRFINALAEEVVKEFPNVMIRTFAYVYSRKAPKLTKAHPNVVVRYCTIEACFRHALSDKSCSRNNEEFNFYEELTEWQKMASNLSIWNYNANYACYLAPFPNLISLRENLRLFADCHAIDIYEEDTSPVLMISNGAYGLLKTYVLGKLLWDPYMSEETYHNHIKEFLMAYYGKGWQEMGKYIKLEHEATANHHVRCFSWIDLLGELPADNLALRQHLRGVYQAYPYQPTHSDHALIGLTERIDEAYAFMNKAYELADTDIHRSRIRHSRIALDYLKLFCMPHDKRWMSKEEQEEYEAACAEFLEYKKANDLCYNEISGLKCRN